MDTIPRKRSRTETDEGTGSGTGTGSIDNLNIPVSRFRGTNRHELEIRLMIALKRIKHLKEIIENASA